MVLKAILNWIKYLHIPMFMHLDSEVSFPWRNSHCTLTKPTDHLSFKFQQSGDPLKNKKEKPPYTHNPGKESTLICMKCKKIINSECDPLSRVSRTNFTLREALGLTAWLRTDGLSQFRVADPRPMVILLTLLLEQPAPYLLGGLTT